jgi:hypothetical protein
MKRRRKVAGVAFNATGESSGGIPAGAVAY